jgi:hypothetical protein
MAAPFLNLIPGVGQVASLAAGAASAGLGMAANNAMTAQSEEQAMLEANRMGNDYARCLLRLYTNVGRTRQNGHP